MVFRDQTWLTWLWMWACDKPGHCVRDFPGSRVCFDICVWTYKAKLTSLRSIASPSMMDLQPGGFPDPFGTPVAEYVVLSGDLRLLSPHRYIVCSGVCALAFMILVTWISYSISWGCVQCATGKWHSSAGKCQLRHCSAGRSGGWESWLVGNWKVIRTQHQCRGAGVGGLICELKL